MSDTENQLKSTYRARIFGKLWLTFIQLFGFLLVIPWLFQYVYPYLKYRSLGNTTIVFEYFEGLFERIAIHGMIPITLIIWKIEQHATVNCDNFLHSNPDIVLKTPDTGGQQLLRLFL